MGDGTGVGSGLGPGSPESANTATPFPTLTTTPDVSKLGSDPIGAVSDRLPLAGIEPLATARHRDE